MNFPLHRTIWNPTISQLYQEALQQGCQVSSTGALVAYSGSVTGRLPQYKRIVHCPQTEKIWWGEVNRPISTEAFQFLQKEAQHYLEKHPCQYVLDGYAGWDKGQLENEIENGDWLIMPSDDRFIFSIANSEKWEKAASQFGINITDLSGSAGMA